MRALLLAALLAPLAGCIDSVDVPVLVHNGTGSPAAVRMWANATSPPWQWSGVVPANSEASAGLVRVPAGVEVQLVAAPEGLPALASPVGGRVRGLSLWLDGRGAHFVPTYALGA